MPSVRWENVDAYIASFPESTQVILGEVRTIIQKAVPTAEEKISYQIPAYMYHGRLVYFAAYKGHYALYGLSRTVRTRFEKELAGLVQAKGTIRFPLDEPVPKKLIRALVLAQATANRDGEPRDV